MSFDIIEDKILKRNNICIFDLLNLINELFLYKFDYGDIYFQDSCKEYLLIENEKVKNNYFNINSGVSLKLNIYDKTIFSCTNNISKNSIFNIIKNFKSILDSNILVKKKKLLMINNNLNNNFISPINFNLNKDKIDLLLYLNNYIKKLDNRINYISLNLNSKYDLVLIVNTDGEYSWDIRPLINLYIKVQIENNNCKEIGISGGGGCYDFNYLISKKRNNLNILKYWANEAVRIAINNLNAINAPIGKMPIILGSGSPAILLHEAIGHGLEGDFNRRGVSLFSNLLGKKIASSLCTIVDDNRILGKCGSINIDDEGVLAQKRILVKNGILESFMLDKLNARLMNMLPNGSARRESFFHIPCPRMTNTYLKNGNSLFCDVINSVDYGLYIANLSGGQVDITSGNFVFTILEGYLIKKGKIINSVKGATLIGSSIKTMKKISMVCNDLKFDDGLGICGKDNQNIPVGIGQPTLKVDSMIVGGINKK